MTSLTVAAAQFPGTENWEENLETCLAYMSRADEQGVDLMVFPEAAFRTRNENAQHPGEPQPLTGPFIDRISAATVGTNLTVVVGTIEKTADPRPSNTLVAITAGEVRAVYRKIHLYDAFSRKESDRVRPGSGPLTVIDVKGFGIGMMNCYDVRFPEVARSLAAQGADVLVLPASWVAGPLKEMHWRVMTQARAMENTCFLVAAGKTGPTRIGNSCVIDPLGVIRSQLGHETGMFSFTITRAEIDDVRTELPLLQQRRMQSDLQPVPTQSS